MINNKTLKELYENNLITKDVEFTGVNPNTGEFDIFILNYDVFNFLSGKFEPHDMVRYFDDLGINRMLACNMCKLK